jgi:protein-disulfide isomerase
MWHSWRAVVTQMAMGCAFFCLAACGAPGDATKGAEFGGDGSGQVTLPGVDTSSLTAPEHRDWSAFVTELSAPCPDHPVSLKQCVMEQRHCRACLPAARFLFSQIRLGKTSVQVQAAYDARFGSERVKSIDIGGSPAKGAERPSIVIVEWADFQCPFCGASARALAGVVAGHSDQVRLVFKHYPIQSHPLSAGAARAAVAADRQGRFWRMHDLMFQNPTRLDQPGLQKLAVQAGLDVPRFVADLESPGVAAVVDRDRQQADALGLTGTPMVYVNGRRFDLDHFSLTDDLDDWVELELEIVGPAGQGGGSRQAAGSGAAP